MVAIELFIEDETEGETAITVSLVDGGASPLFPSGLTAEQLEIAVVATATASGSLVPSWTTFDFSNAGIALDPDKHYFIWPRMLPPLPSDSNLRLLWVSWIAKEFPDPYLGGRSFYCAAEQTCSVEVQFWDYSFRVRMLPDAPVCGQ